MGSPFPGKIKPLSNSGHANHHKKVEWWNMLPAEVYQIIGEK